MVKQYLKQALRMLAENKLLSIISILGTALAICMIMVIVILYVVNTAGFRPEVNRDRTYYFSAVMSLGKDDGRRISFSGLGMPLIRECIYPLQSVETVTAVARDDWNKTEVASMDGLNNYSASISFTDTAFWKVFDFDFVEGAPFSAADFGSGLYSVVISQSVARKLFGAEKAAGKELKLDYVVFRVAGVVKDVSRFANKAYADVWAPYTVQEGIEKGYREGINGPFSCYVLMKQGHTQERMREELLNRVAAFNTKQSECKADLGYQPRSQVEEWLMGGNEFAADLFAFYLRYGIILFILLLVPALNLSGITLTRMRKRVAELGVRRAFGATRGNIVGLVLLENMMLTLMGGVLGLTFSYAAMWMLKDWLLVTSLGETGISAGMFNGLVFVAALFFCLLMNLMSAGIPAWRVSRVNITDSING